MTKENEATLEQIGVGRMNAMVGAYNWTVRDDATISFRFKGSKEANYVSIEYVHATDTYTMKFLMIGHGLNSTIKEVENVADVYCDNVHETFELVTGLLTRL